MALWVAAQRAQVQTMQEWLDSTCRVVGAATSATVNALCDALCTWLKIAAANDHWVVVRLLLSSGFFASLHSDVQVSMCSGALQTAARHESRAVVSGMLEHSMQLLPPEAAKRSRRIALSTAVEWTHVQTAKLLLATKADIRGRPGDTPLLFRAICRPRTRARNMACANTISLLLKFKADIHGKNFVPLRSRRTPLAHAVMFRAPAVVVARLLRAKADPNDSTNSFGPESGQPVLSEAVNGGHVKIVTLLLQFKAGVDLPFKAGADSVDFRTDLLKASLRRGHPAVAEILRNALDKARPTD